MVYVIQCDPEVPPGTVADELEALSAAWRLVRLDRGESLPPLSAAPGIIVLGGSMSAHDEEQFPFLRQLKAFIHGAVQAEVPFLGICLGGQLLADAMGGRVVRQRWGERGSCMIEIAEAGRADSLFRGFGGVIHSFQWHSDSFDLPAGAVLLASSADCPHQAFRIGANAWGLQFHPEVTPAIIAAWASDEGLADGEVRFFIHDWERDAEQHRQVISGLMRSFVRG